ncbi:fucolectin-3-like [Gigantopelta aegis]|uniref:fucolectin-3-like n=1 Tax=Gigantopelta aegis TaxID=1735272 RepID=UPI001B88B9B8|nr:fucolectin-3-like [Gigantopelta aegis]
MIQIQFPHLRIIFLSDHTMEVLLFVFYILALGHGSETNIALYKTARQSSIFGVDVASRAVDGDTNSNYQFGSCMHTKPGYGLWWEVDLFGFFEIDRVVVFNRGDCCSDRLKNFTIYVFVNDPHKFVNEKPLFCGDHPGAAGISVTITCQTGVRGRFLRITHYNRGYALTMCEVQVYGDAAPKPSVIFEPQSDISWTASYPVDRSYMYQCNCKCFRTDTCLAFDYNIQSHECQMVDTNTYTPKGEPWVYYGIKKFISTSVCN